MGSNDDMSAVIAGKQGAVETADHYRTLKKGDDCRILDDKTGRYRFVEWFRYANGNECVQLYGGSPGRAMHRFVGVDALVVPSAKVQPPSDTISASTPAPLEVPTGAEFETRRKELKLSRSQLADQAGTTHAAVASVEAGRNPRDKEAPAKMMTVLWPGGADADEVIEGWDPDDLDDDDEDEY